MIEEEEPQISLVLMLEVAVEHVLYVVLAFLEVGWFAIMKYKAHEFRRMLISQRSICWQFQMQVTERSNGIGKLSSLYKDIVIP